MAFLKSADVSRARENRAKGYKSEGKVQRALERIKRGKIFTIESLPIHLTEPECSAVSCGKGREAVIEVASFGDDASAQKGVAHDSSQQAKPPEAKQKETFSINKVCSTSFVENIQTSVFIGMDFEFKTTLKVELEKDSIQNIYLKHPEHEFIEDNHAPSLKTILNSFAHFVVSAVDRKITELSSLSTDSNQRLVFTREDGLQLIMELSPDAIKKIDLTPDTIKKIDLT